MKRIFLLVALILPILTSCHKEVDRFTGDYSFKISGQISISAETISEDGEYDLSIPASLVVDLPTEIGQLNISVSDRKNDEVIVVINYMNGDVITTTGTCHDKTLELDEFRRNILPVSVSSIFLPSTNVKVGGTGHLYDEDLIVFDMTCQGRVTLDSTTFKLREKDIRMVAYRN